MAEQITISFKGKRREMFDGEYGYSVPDIAPHHVVTPIAQLGARARMWLDCKDAEIRKTRRVAALKRAGLDGYTVTEPDALKNPDTVTIEPLGNGFMARVTLTLEV